MVSSLCHLRYPLRDLKGVTSGPNIDALTSWTLGSQRSVHIAYKQQEIQDQGVQKPKGSQSGNGKVRNHTLRSRFPAQQFIADCYMT